MMPMVLLHGYPFDHTLWNSVIEGLHWKDKLFVPDLPGFGKNPALDGEPALERMADHVVQLLAREKIDRFILGGFSMGGYVSLAIAQKTPARISGLALINSQPFADSDEVRSGRRTIIQKVRQEGVEAAINAALPKLFAPEHTSNPELTRFAKEGAQKSGVAGITWALEAMARRPDRTEFLANFDVPKLVIHSPEDKFIPVDKIRTLVARLSNLQYTEIANAGHCTPLEASDAVAKALGDWAIRVRE
jgi:pimeloyl-ACP methyl ester carboxylesterase